MLSTDHYVDLKQGEFKGTSPANLRAAFNALELSKRDHLVVHFHGGLVSHSSAMDSAERLNEVYDSAGAYPFFFIWNSDLLSVISGNLGEILSEEIFRALVRQVLRNVAGHWLPAEGRAGVPQVPPLKEVPADLEGMAAYADKLEATPAAIQETLTLGERQSIALEFETDKTLARELDNIIAGLTNEQELTTARSAGTWDVTPKRTRMDPAVLQDLGAEPSAGQTRGLIAMGKLAIHGVKIVARVIKRKFQGRDHGLMVTVVEEVLREFYVAGIGADVWGAMKDDTFKAFGGDTAVHGGTAFLDGLQQWLAASPARRLTLVGHSTGAIYIIYFLQFAAKLAAMRPVRVAWLAPACRFDLTRANLPLLQKWVERIRVFGLSDPVERGYYEVPVIYHASLLYMVSGLFEESNGDTPLIGMQRYYSGHKPYAGPEIGDVINWLKGTAAWSVATGQPAGWNTGAQRHGGFSDDPETRASLAAFLQEA